jgi:serine/threonine protein kinase
MVSARMSRESPIPPGQPSSFEPGKALRGLRPGQRVADRFLLERILGRGGMGVVWRAIDEGLDQPVAFKFLAEPLATNDAAILDLKREVRKSRRLTHANIIRVHDFVEDRALGVAGITMEEASGGNLHVRRAQTVHGWFEPDEIVMWMGQLCEALDHAHRVARVVHRDLKPANLLLDHEGHLKVADFGISAALQESATKHNEGGGISGTPMYMSPEQAQGAPAKPSDDLYALGATIYELLTSKPPFYSGNILAAVAAVAPVSMRQRRMELERIDAPLPRDWEETVAALLAKRAEDRPSSALEVIRMLDQERTHVPRMTVRVRRPGSSQSPGASSMGGSTAGNEPVAAPAPAANPSPPEPPPVIPAPVPLVPIPPRPGGDRRWWIILLLVLAGVAALSAALALVLD